MRLINIVMLSTLLLGIFAVHGADAINTATEKNTALFAGEVPFIFEAGNGEQVEAVKGFIRAPENRNNPQSRQIEVHYVRFAATGDKKGPPIIYLAGGPGGSGINTAKGPRFPLFMALREFGDVIALDQRGTGASATTEQCLFEQAVSLTEKLSEAQMVARYRLAAQECLQKWQQQGADVYGYTTVQNALDLDALRQHLQADKVVLWGISYGSHLALAALKLFDNKIDKVILASAEGLAQTVKLPARTDQYFDQLQQLINQDAHLRTRFTDIKAMIKQVHASVEQQPLLVNVPRQDGSHYPMLVQKYHLQLLTSMLIADPGKYTALLLGLYQSLQQGQTTVLAQTLAHGMFEPAIRLSLMPLAMDIASGIDTDRLKLVAEQAKTSTLGAMLNFPMPHLHNLMPAFDLGDDFRQGPESSVPTLLFTGTLDGRTYPEAQAEAVSGLTNLVQVTVENAGHNVFMTSPEILSTMQRFMRGEKISHSRIITDPKLGSYFTSMK